VCVCVCVCVCACVCVRVCVRVVWLFVCANTDEGFGCLYDETCLQRNLDRTEYCL